MKCPNCNNEVLATEDFCRNCGFELNPQELEEVEEQEIEVNEYDDIDDYEDEEINPIDKYYEDDYIENNLDDSEEETDYYEEDSNPNEYYEEFEDGVSYEGDTVLMSLDDIKDYQVKADDITDELEDYEENDKFIDGVESEKTTEMHPLETAALELNNEKDSFDEIMASYRKNKNYRKASMEDVSIGQILISIIIGILIIAIIVFIYLIIR